MKLRNKKTRELRNAEDVIMKGRLYETIKDDLKIVFGGEE